jgi:hypothetical protein
MRGLFRARLALVWDKTQRAQRRGERKGIFATKSTKDTKEKLINKPREAVGARGKLHLHCFFFSS